MVREQINRYQSYERELTESELLIRTEMREKASSILELLLQYGLINSFAYGSIARGDIKNTSDIDIFTNVQTSYKMEFAIESNYIIEERYITQATPNHTPKAIIKIRETQEISISFPLLPLRSREEEFYSFGGKITIDELKNNLLKNGINKKLELVEPLTEKLFRYTPIINQIQKVSKILNISQDIITERIRVLEKRNEIGRHGVYLKRVLSPTEQFESVFKHMVDSNISLKRFVKKYS